MASASQRKASATTRSRAAARGLVRVEVQTDRGDAGLIRGLAETLRGEPERAARLRTMLSQALDDKDGRTAFDVFGSDLPEEAFTGVFGQPRQKGWREVDL